MFLWKWAVGYFLPFRPKACPCSGPGFLKGWKPCSGLGESVIHSKSLTRSRRLTSTMITELESGRCSLGSDTLDFLA